MGQQDHRSFPPSAGPTNDPPSAPNERVLLVEGRQLTSSVCLVAKSQLLILEKKALSGRLSRGGPTLYEVHPGPQRLRSEGLSLPPDGKCPFECFETFLERYRAGCP